MVGLVAMEELGQRSAGAPVWLTWVSLGLGILNALVLTVPMIIYARRKARLNFRLTKELSLRISPAGETMHAFASLSPIEGGVTVLDVDIEVSKSGDLQKQYPYRIHSLGFKQPRIMDPTIQWAFDTTSPYQNIAEYETVQRIWFCVSKAGQTTKLKKVIEDCFQEVQRIQWPTEDTEKDRKDELLEALKNKWVPEIWQFVEMEPGEWEVKATVHYRPFCGPWRRKQDETVASSLKFRVEEDFPNLMKEQLRNWLEQLVDAHLGLRKTDPLVPEYIPPEIEEVDSQKALARQHSKQ
ncbi:MAG: hypothetical protein AB1725_06475 [Armatimonadota bacterium]